MEEEMIDGTDTGQARYDAVSVFAYDNHKN